MVKKMLAAVVGKTAALKLLLEIMNRRRCRLDTFPGSNRVVRKIAAGNSGRNESGKSKSISKLSKLAETLSRSG